MHRRGRGPGTGQVVQVSSSRLQGEEHLRAAMRSLIDSRYGQALKPKVARVLAFAGFELVALRRDDRKHLLQLLDRLEVATVFDIGANQGQFATSLRRSGYGGRILSVEPMKAAYRMLKAETRRDPLWSACRAAVGKDSGKVPLNIARNSTSSSLLTVSQLHVDAEPASRTRRIELVECRPLDEIAAEHSLPSPYFLKIDVQGNELTVLQSGPETLRRTAAVRVEASLRQLYEGAPDFSSIVSWLNAEGFVPVKLEPAFEDPRSGDTLQVDVVACRRTLL
jgi:FkbM family methyltransferase